MVVVVVRSLSCVRLFAISWTAACQPSLPFTISVSLLKLMFIELVMPSNCLILCCPLLLPSVSPSIRVFSSESALCIRWPKYWSLSISPSNKYSGLISFRIDWFDLLAVPEILKSLLQHHNLKASILLPSAFFTIQLSRLYMTTGKTTAWTLDLLLLLFSCSVVSNSLQPHGLQHARLPCPASSPRVCSNSCPSSRDAIQPSHPLLSSSPPAFNLSQYQGLFQWVSSLHQVAEVLELQLQHQSF